MCAFISPIEIAYWASAMSEVRRLVPRQVLHEPSLPGRQRGAALVVVIALLVSALMIGIVSVQSALIDERLASNYRASIMAQMRAETAASQAIVAFADLEWDSNVPVIDELHETAWQAYITHPAASVLDSECPQGSCFYIPVERAGKPWIMALGAVISPDREGKKLLAQSLPIFIRVVEDSSTPEETKATVIWQ